MTICFAAESTANVFKLQEKLLMSEVESISFYFDDNNVLFAQVNVPSITVADIHDFFDPSMKISFMMMDTAEPMRKGKNIFQFSAECVEDVQEWLEKTPESLVKSMTVSFLKDLPDVLVEVCMEEHITLRQMKTLLSHVKEGQVMVESVEAHLYISDERVQLSQEMCKFYNAN